MDKENETGFDWEGPNRRERLKRLGNRLLYFFFRKGVTFEPPEPNHQDKPPEVIPENDKDDWYFPQDWLEPKNHED